MTIEYKDKRTQIVLEDNKALSKEFGRDVAKSFKKFRTSVAASDNLFKLYRMRPGLAIEKVKGTKHLHAARLNKQYRVEFTTKEELMIMVISITIVRIHPHKY